jgi:lipoate-protein ligase A
MLYINAPSIIIGKHQNAFAEINYQFVKEHDIPVIRRLSGGGAVYHDKGNLNFTFISNSLEGKQIDFKRFLKPILEVLQQLGVPAVANNRNDILISDLKCSGNAEHVYKNRTLHHGTLLFDTNLNDLRKALNSNNNITITDKSVKSVSSHVTNISGYLNAAITMEHLKDTIANHISEAFPGISRHTFSDNDIIQITSLADEKYRTWEWNFGYSPRFVLNKTEIINGCSYELTLEVENGIINSAKITENEVEIPKINELMIGIKYKENLLELKFPGISTKTDTLRKLFFG